MATPIQYRRFLSLPLSITERSPWMIWFIILWTIVVIAVPLLLKFVIHTRFYSYIIYAVVMLLVAPAIFGKQKVAEATAAAPAAVAPIMSASRPRRSVDVQMEVFDYSISRDDVTDGSGQVCVICFCNYEEDGQPALSLPVCRHNFHVACIQRWLQCHGRCPICTETPISAQPLSQRSTDLVRVSVVVDAPESPGAESADV